MLTFASGRRRRSRPSWTPPRKQFPCYACGGVTRGNAPGSHVLGVWHLRLANGVTGRGVRFQHAAPRLTMPKLFEDVSMTGFACAVARREIVLEAATFSASADAVEHLRLLADAYESLQRAEQEISRATLALDKLSRVRPLTQDA